MISRMCCVKIGYRRVRHSSVIKFIIVERFFLWIGEKS